MATRKLFYKIGEVCEICGIQPHVLRYWESEFSVLSPTKNRSGQRIYRQKDLETIELIKHLLYQEGYTIAGANKKLLEDGGNPAGRLPLMRKTLRADQKLVVGEIMRTLQEILDILDQGKPGR
ncbi:MAG: MerR family transcriptional regulator [Acidobacteriota bacterium]